MLSIWSLNLLEELVLRKRFYPQEKLYPSFYIWEWDPLFIKNYRCTISFKNATCYYFISWFLFIEPCIYDKIF